MSDSNETSVGTSMDDIYNGRGPWCFEVPPINISRRHAVLYEMPVTLKNPPKPHISLRSCHWDNNHVRMPYSPQNLFPVKEENGEECLKERWGIIEAALLQPIRSSRELEAIICSYNTRLPKFLALHHFFEEILEEEESVLFFENLLPKIIGLALRLPEILPGSLPLLKKDCNKSISISQLQIASLLANAFLCTFPWRKESAALYPGANFVRLFAAHLRPNREEAVAEKLKCIFHYFRRVTDSEPVGVLTFDKKYIAKSQLPDWNHESKTLGETRLHVSSKGFIEDDGLGLLQVDFANKNVGGGVLGFGCVQEEIRFVICPELIISRLFTEQIGPTESLLIIGAERYSTYGGYGDSFTWEGNCNDTTPHDAWGRRRTTIVAIDALRFVKPKEQYDSSAMTRELNKAYAGFHSHTDQQLPAVATGNWGCGAFRGDPKLKGLLQLMACSVARRDMVYYTFGNEELLDDLYKMHSFIVTQQIKVSQLWHYLVKYSKSNVKPEHLYAYIQQSHLDAKNKPSLKTFFGSINFKKYDKSRPSTSTDTTANVSESDLPQIIEPAESSEEIIDSSQWNNLVVESSEELEIIESSQPDECGESMISSLRTTSTIKEQNEILRLFDMMDTDAEQTERFLDKNVQSDAVPTTCEIMDTSELKHQLIMNSNETSSQSSPKRKITDYFLKVDKG